jgi:hypothetical protein
MSRRLSTLGAALRLPGDDPPPLVRSDSWWDVLASVWPRTDVPWSAKKILGALIILAEGRTGRINATMGEIGCKAGVSIKTASRGVKALGEAGAVEWLTIGPNFVNGIRLTRTGSAGAICPSDFAPPYNPPTRKNLNTAAGRDLSGLERSNESLPADTADLVRELMAFSKSITPGAVLAALQEYAVADRGYAIGDIRAGLAEARALAKSGGIRRSAWGLILSVARRARYQRKLEADAAQLGLVFDAPSEPAPIAPAPVAKAAPVMSIEEQVAALVAMARTGPASARKMARGVLVDGLASGLFPHELVPAELLCEHSAQKEPAVGPVGKHPPQPVGGPSPDATPNSTAEVTPSKIEATNQVGPRARQDSNLQPSDSKSATLPGRLTHTCPGVVTLASCLRAFSLPEDDPKPTNSRLYRGSDVRDSMRC